MAQEEICLFTDARCGAMMCESNMQAFPSPWMWMLPRAQLLNGEQLFPDWRLPCLSADVPIAFYGSLAHPERPADV